MDMLAQAERITSMEFNMASLKTGQDGQVEVAVSPAFLKSARETFHALLRQQACATPRYDNNEKLYSTLRKHYLEVCSQLIHRVKSDLNVDEVRFLHFAIIKAVVCMGHTSLNDYIEERKNRANELKIHGSGELLRVQEHLAWLHKYSNLVLYRILKPVLAELNRVETKQLRKERAQFSKSSFDTAAVLFTPALATRDLELPHFLLDHFYVWEQFQETFSAFNLEVEQLFRREVPTLQTLALKKEPLYKTDRQFGQTTLFEAYLHQKGEQPPTELGLSMCWLDSPEAIETLFNPDVHSQTLSVVRKTRGLRAAWQYYRQTRRMKALMRQVNRLVFKYRLLPPSLASKKLHALWSSQLSRYVDISLLHGYLSGHYKIQQVLDKLPRQCELKSEDMDLLKTLFREVRQEVKGHSMPSTLQLLRDMARFRRHLKHRHFISKVFDQIRLLESEEGIQHSRLAGDLYELYSADEIISSGRDTVAHQCILSMEIQNMDAARKALSGRGVEGARFIDEHFMSPIKNQIKLFGANIIALTDRGMTLSFHEYEKVPEQWYAVSHASALAQKILGCLNSFNAQCKAIRLPMIECSIGIAYADYSGKREDGSFTDKASTLAAHLARCLAESSSEDKTNGAYKHNGVILSKDAFDKLRHEIILQQITTQLKGRKETVYSGSTIVPERHRAEFWIREGRFSTVQLGPVADSFDDEQLACYELISNAELIDSSRKSAAMHTSSDTIH